ncbi:MAG TPA: LamG-like jellyroll fold domain-containing protein [Chthoniobacteraceae bacterium]|nr:LamG-like jellyroll fold domain-containing protein [Chthoniobacteraceae bacterium]
MIKPTIVLAAYLFCIQPWASLADSSPPQEKQITPDTVQRQRKTDRTYVFSRAQWKYGLERDDYLSRWVDRPLFVNPELRDTSEPRSVYYPSFLRIREVLEQYGLDGMAFFPETTGRSIIYDYAARSGKDGFKILSEFFHGGDRSGKVEVVGKAIHHPASFTIDGKLVITSYNADKPPLDLKYWKEVLGEIKAKYGERIIFLPSFTRFGNQSLTSWREKFNRNAVTPEDEEQIRQRFREWLRVTDGLYYSIPSVTRDEDRRFDPVFFRDFIVRMMKSVLSEPEFKDKYFALPAGIGHENVTRVGYIYSSDGTKTLRGSFEAALAAEPDIINIPEWDEQNENTSLRPTVYNGTSSMRIMRYYMAGIKGEKLTPLAGDDLKIPNLIVSYRKVLVLGEKLEVELLNVPDSTDNAAYTARLTLLDPEGTPVYTSEAFRFSRDHLTDHTVSIPSETLAAHRVLIPRLEIDTDGEKTIFMDGLHYIDLRATWNWDYKWVKQPLRDLLNVGKADLQLSKAGSRETRTATGAITAGEPLAYVDVLDNDDVIYTHSPSEKWRDNEEQVILSIDWEKCQWSPKMLPLEGSISLSGASARWLLPEGERAGRLRGQTLSNLQASIKPNRALLAIPRKEIGTAVLKVAMPGIYEGTIAVNKILDQSLYALAGPYGVNIVISHYTRQYRIPFHLNEKEAAFEVPVTPDLSHSIFHLQVITPSGRLYRSKPVVIGEAANRKETITVYSDTKRQPVTVEVTADRVPDIRYHFDPRHGAALMTDAGRSFWGLLGGNVTQVVERGGGEGGDGTPFIKGKGRDPEIPITAPDWVKGEDGQYALAFDGKGTFVTLPQGVIPRRSAFTISMDIKPGSGTGRQVILGNRAYHPGSLMLYLNQGVLEAELLTASGESARKSTGLPLPSDQWSHLVVTFDQESLICSVNGKSQSRIGMKGPGVGDTVTVVGGYGDGWFKGEIKSLRIRHRAISAMKTLEKVERSDRFPAGSTAAANNSAHRTAQP